MTEFSGGTYRDPPSVEPVDAPNVEMATKTAGIQAAGPK